MGINDTRRAGRMNREQPISVTNVRSTSQTRTPAYSSVRAQNEGLCKPTRQTVMNRNKTGRSPQTKSGPVGRRRRNSRTREVTLLVQCGEGDSFAATRRLHRRPPSVSVDATTTQVSILEPTAYDNTCLGVRDQTSPSPPARAFSLRSAKPRIQVRARESTKACSAKDLPFTMRCATPFLCMTSMPPISSFEL